jgi:hypothetical protein
MDEVLREALVLPNADKFLGGNRERWEYREGELVVIPATAAAGSPAAPPGPPDRPRGEGPGKPPAGAPAAPPA